MAQPDHQKVLEFVRKNSCPFVTTGDVSEQFDTVSDRTIRKRLHDLVEQERLQVREIGPGSKVWYIPD